MAAVERRSAPAVERSPEILTAHLPRCQDWHVHGPYDAVMINRACLRCVASVLFLGLGAASGVAAPVKSPLLEPAVPNDNTRPAGVLLEGTLTLRLRAAEGSWKPEGPDGPVLPVEALGEVSSPLTVPAPLIRVVEGTQIAVSVRNDLDSVLRVHGLCARDGSPCAPVNVAPGHAREVRFPTGRAGTYHYWATTMGAPVPFREMAGALIVDSAKDVAEPDRVLVVTEWTDLTGDQLGAVINADDSTEAFLAFKPRFTFVINGLSWPATERLTYRMHLHGFYFSVVSLGDGTRDAQLGASHQRRVVTQLLPPGGTMTMTWMPEREGNWLFHCHIMHHVSPMRRLAEPAGSRADQAAGPHVGHQAGLDASGGMAGMILGVTVLASDGAVATRADVVQAPSRKLTLTLARRATGDSGAPESGFVLTEGDVPADGTMITSPGPTLVLHRNEPVEIIVVNRLPEATAIHWHGMELDSYYDGVHGWSGTNQRLAPMIEPGESFTVRFTPPRTGSFIYHTHLHDYRQLSSGLYGALVVVDAGEAFDPTTDHVLVLGRRGVASEEAGVVADPSSAVLNGERTPRFVWKAGDRHRLRLVNITPDDIFVVSLQTTEEPMTWTPLTKDGAPAPAAESVLRPARQTIAVGETYDFEFLAPAGRKTAWIEVSTTSGRWQVQGQVIIK
jgi:manganese oxidase